MPHPIQAALIGLSLISLPTEPDQATDPFWAEQRRGANFFNEVDGRQRIADAAAAGIDFIRLTPSKWVREDGAPLLGDLTQPYDGLVTADVEHLRDLLDTAERHGVKIVLTLLDLPGMNGRAPGQPTQDTRLWRDYRYHEQAAAVWRDIADALGGHPALAGYNPLNEPQPERALAELDDPSDPAFATFHASHENSPADLNVFYSRVVSAIRTVDPHTPIHIESGAYAAPGAMAFLKPIDAANIMYSVHMYPSWLYGTSRANQGRFSYPDAMPVDWNGQTEPWGDGQLCATLDPLMTWADTHLIGHDQLIVSEFGVSRRVDGAHAYLEDIVACLESHGLHWAFYAYREDGWDEMDYELSVEAGWAPSHTDEHGYRIKPWLHTELYEVLHRRLNAQP